MTRLLIISPPGSGKGTQAEHVARHFGVPALSTGDIFRSNVSRQTELGNQAANYLDGAELEERMRRRALEQGRTDDTPDVFRRRLDLYHRQTHEVVSVYAGPGILVSVNGSGDPGTITGLAIAAVEQFLAAPRPPS